MIGRLRSQLGLAFLVAATMAVAPAFGAGGLSFDDDGDAAAAGLGEADTARWYTIEYQDTEGAATFALLYGVPESDAVLFSTSCALGVAAKSVKVDLMVDFDQATPDEDVGAIIEAGNKSFSFPAKVFADSAEFTGVRLRVGSKSPLWSALRTAPAPRFGVEGSSNMSSASADGAKTAFADFTANCLGDTPATGPVIVKPAEEAGTPSKPLVAAVPRIAAPPAVSTFACDDGSIVGIGGEPSARVASVLLASGGVLSLIPTTASFGEKYSDGTTTLRVSGATAQLTTSDGNQLCRMR